MLLVPKETNVIAEGAEHDMFASYPIAGSVDDAAQALGVCPKTIRSLINKGELGSIRVARTVRVTRDHLRAFVKNQEV